MYGVKKGLGSVNSYANTVSQQRILPAGCQGLFIVLLVALDNKIIKKQLCFYRGHVFRQLTEKQSTPLFRVFQTPVFVCVTRYAVFLFWCVLGRSCHWMWCLPSRWQFHLTMGRRRRRNKNNYRIAWQWQETCSTRSFVCLNSTLWAELLVIFFVLSVKDLFVYSLHHIVDCKGSESYAILNSFLLFCFYLHN